MTTIYDQLAARLGRKPTHEETKAEVRRILADAKLTGTGSPALYIQTIGRAERTPAHDKR